MLGRVTEDRDDIHRHRSGPRSIHELLLIGFHRLPVLFVLETFDDLFVRWGLEDCNAIAIRYRIATVFQQLQRFKIDVALHLQGLSAVRCHPTNSTGRDQSVPARSREDSS